MDSDCPNVLIRIIYGFDSSTPVVPAVASDELHAAAIYFDAGSSNPPSSEAGARPAVLGASPWLLDNSFEILQPTYDLAMLRDDAGSREMLRKHDGALNGGL